MSTKRQRGLTIIELTMFIVIMGIALAGILAVMDRSSRMAPEPIQRKQAILRAEAVLEEIALAQFTFCHPTDANAEVATGSTTCASPTLRENFGPQVAGESRPYFNVNDYVSGAGVSTIVTTDANGVPLQPAGYNTTITIEPVEDFGPPGLEIGSIPVPLGASSDVLRIAVTVEYSGGKVVLDRYRTRYAPTSMP